jgi:hypothetical protein
LVLVDRGDQLLRVVRLGNDVYAFAAEERSDALAHQAAVVGDHDSHGSSAVTTVPALGGLRIRSEPSRAATRSASPWRPVPAVSSAPPTPSSSISMVAMPFRRATRITEGAVHKHVSAIFNKLGLPASDNDDRRILAVLAYVLPDLHGQPTEGPPQDHAGCI